MLDGVRLVAIVAGLLLSFCAQIGANQMGGLGGVVEVRHSGEALNYANVVLTGTTRYAVTDGDGSFFFADLVPGMYRLYVSHIGFESVEREVLVRAGETTTVAFQLVERPGRLDPVVVTGSRSPNPLARSPVTAHVVDAASQPVGLHTAADLLRHLPGIDLSGGGAPGLVAGVSIRGASPAQTLIMLDGARVNTGGQTSTLGGVDLGEIDVDRIDRVEVIKGPGSVMYGAGAGGGVIQIFTRGVDAEARTDISVVTGAGSRVDEDGTYATQRYHLFHGRQRGLLEWNGSASMGSSGGHIENTDARTWNLSGALIRRRDDGDGRTAVRASLVRRRGGAPGAEGLGQFGSFDIDDRQIDDIVRIGLRERRRIRSDAQFEGNALAQWWQVERLNPILDAGELAGDFRSTHQIWTLDPRVSLTRGYLRPLTFGAEWRIERQEDDLFGTKTANVGAAYVQNRFEFGPRAEVEIGGRVDAHSIYGTEFSPRVAGVAQVGAGAALHASLGRAFVAPTFDDLLKPTELFPEPIGEVVGETGNPDLEPEQVWSADVGVRWQAVGAQGEASLYWSRYRDLILPQTVSKNFAGEDRPFLSIGNLAEANITGLELTQKVLPFRGSELQLSYTYQDASGKDAEGDRRDLIGRLRQKLSADYTLWLPTSKPASLSLRADWQERFYSDELLGDEASDDDDDEGAAAIGAPGDEWRYLTIGISSRWHPTAALSVHVDAANLADERFQSVFGIPQPGRIVTVGARFRLSD